MARYDESSNQVLPERTTNTRDQLGFRHHGDNVAAPFRCARLQAYNAVALAYQDLLIDDATGALKTSAGSGSAPSKTDDSVFAVGSDLVSPLGALADNTAPDSVDEGDIGVVRMSANRNLFVTLRDAAGNERGLNVDAGGNIGVSDAGATLSVDDGAGSLTVDGTVTVQDGGNVISVDDGAGSLTVDNAALAVTGGGAEASAQRVTLASDSTGVLSVDDNGGSLTVDNAGTFAVQAGGSSAHDAVDSGDPVKVGYKAIAHGANPTAVAAADRTDAYANRHGVPWVIGGHPNVQTLRTNYTAAQTDAALVTVGAGTKIVVTRCTVTVDNACSVDVQARVGFGATTTPTGAGVLLSHPGIAAGSGVVEGTGAGMLGVGADGEDLRITSEVPTGGSIDVVVSYYTIES